MKEIPRKNYIILGVILLLTVLLAFYVRDWYITSMEYYSSNSVIKNEVREINENEIGSYTIESQKFILYVSSGVNSDIKNFEKEFRKIIERIDNEDILYLNLDNVDVTNFNDNLKDNFALNNRVASQITDSPSSIYIFQDGKIVGVLSDANTYSNSNIEAFLKKWGFKND